MHFSGNFSTYGAHFAEAVSWKVHCLFRIARNMGKKDDTEYWLVSGFWTMPFVVKVLFFNCHPSVVGSWKTQKLRFVSDIAILGVELRWFRGSKPWCLIRSFRSNPSINQVPEFIGLVQRNTSTGNYSLLPSNMSGCQLCFLQIYGWSVKNATLPSRYPL